MKLSVFAILLISLGACQKDCITKSSGKKNNISPSDSNEQNETDNIKVILDNQAKIKSFLNNSADLDNIFNQLQNAHNDEDKQQALNKLKNTIDNYKDPANPNFTALEIAAFTGNKDMLDIMLKAGANVNIKNSDGNTPLHTAVSMSDERKEIVDLLLKHGAKTNIKNNDNEIPLDKAVKNDIKVILQNKAVDNNPPAVEDNPPATDNNPPAIDENLGYSAEEKAQYDEILKKPNSEEFINLLKSSLNTFNKKLEHPEMGQNGLDTAEKYIKATEDFSEEEKKLASQKKYLQEYLLVILTEKFATGERVNKDLFTQVISKDLLMAAKANDVIKGNIFQYIDNLDKNSAELPKIIDIEFMNRSANKEITKEVIDKLLTKNPALDVKELFNKLSNTSPTDAKDILAIMLQKSTLDLVSVYRDPQEASGTIRYINNFNQLINGGVNKDLIYKSIRKDRIHAIKEIIKRQDNKELLAEILSKFNNLEIDNDLINNFSNKDQELLKLVWNKAQSEASNINYNSLSEKIIIPLLNILDKEQVPDFISKLTKEELKKVVDEWIVIKFTVLINKFLSTSQVYINNQTQEKPLANINDNFNNLFKQEEVDKLLSMATDKKTIRDKLFKKFKKHVKFDSTKNLKAKIDELLNKIHPPA